MFLPFSPFYMPKGPAIRRGGNYFTEFPLAAAYVFLFFAISYTGKTPAPARQELFFGAPAQGRHMFFSFSPFHMPKGPAIRRGGNFFTEFPPAAAYVYALFAISYAGKTPAPALLELFCGAPAQGRHMFLPFSLFHMPVDISALPWYSIREKIRSSLASIS